MNARRNTLCILFAAIILLLSACQTAALVNSTQPTQQPPATQSPQATAQPTVNPVVVVTQTPAQSFNGISLDYAALAQIVTVETVAAVPANGGPWWEAAPQHRRVSLQGYPVASHQRKPQIFIYPVAELAATGANLGKIAAELKTLLQTQQGGSDLPFLPLSGDKQQMHPQVQYLDFKNGKGVRFLTQYTNGLTPVNNSMLFYTFQGLTSDGKYYIAAILPVTHPELPAGVEISAQMAKSIQDTPGFFTDYLSKTGSLLGQKPANSFTPDLNKLDALIRSIEVK